MRRISITFVFRLFACCVLAGQSAPLLAQQDVLAEVVVTATLRGDRLQALPGSATVLGRETLQAAGEQHLQDVLGLVPNFNWASGTSRPRYFQIRGIGETDQWQGAPNPSVGFMIDGMDFSGLGMPAMLFDVEQVEVLRGPQAASHGANSLAGLINLRTVAPDPNAGWRAEASAGDYGSRGMALALGGALGNDEASAFRLVAQSNQGDGFRRNTFLGRTDTNGFDETVLRGRVSLQLEQDWRLDVATLWADQDNGYDAFAIDNSRVTRSDQPGEDAQRSRGISLAADYDGASSWIFRSSTAFSDAAIRYSFDGDWGADPDYDFTSRFVRDHRRVTQDLRWLSREQATLPGEADWLIGVYALSLSEQNDQLDRFNGDVFTSLASDYRARHVALYGQSGIPLGERTRFSGALRAEQRDADYTDSSGSGFAPRDRMWGGHLSLQHQTLSGSDLFLTLSRGYKAGGFNIGAQIAPQRRAFAPETVLSVEAGGSRRFAGDRLRVSGAIFHMRRSDQQVPTSEQIDPTDPLSFIYYTDNAASGENYGMEFTASWQLSERVALQATGGLLQTRFLDYRSADLDLTGREQAHAPRQQFALTADYRHPSGWFGRVDWTGRDGFYFSESHDQRAGSSQQVNLRVGFERERWNASLWVRNLFDDEPVQRGFFFGNEPPDFPTRLYVQRGDPRQLGVRVQFRSN